MTTSTATTATDNKFAAGQIVSTGPADYEWTFDVVKRTARFVTLRDQQDGRTYRVGIHKGSSGEFALPFGRYSMAPIVRPNR